MADNEHTEVVRSFLRDMDRGDAALSEGERVLNALRDAGENVGPLAQKLASAKSKSDRVKRSFAKHGYI